MINYDSIISAYNDKPTLMEWLKKVEEALKGASATSFSVNKKGNATISFQINFEDGTSLESGDIVLQQGESVTGASIVNGHLILTLSNGDNLDAGNLGAVSSFSIDGSQHLIVTYQDGTTGDLGAIFNGNVNISGILTASSVSTPELTTSAAKIDVLKPVEVTGAVKATTLEQTAANWLSSFAVFMPSQIMKIDNAYGRLEVINGVLFAIVNYKLKNLYGSSLSPTDLGFVNILFSPEIAALIKDVDGNGCDIQASKTTLVCCVPCLIKRTKGRENDFIDAVFTLYNTGTANGAQIVFTTLGLTLDVDEEVYVTGRMALTII